MTEAFRGVINIDIKQSTPDWGPYTQPKAPEGAPNVVYIVLDDVRFAAREPFGGPIQTPTLQRIADRGLSYTNFHTTALCSPTRSCLMTGRNHTTNGHGLHHRDHRWATRTPTATSRSSAPIWPKYWASTAGTPITSGKWHLRARG